MTFSEYIELVSWEQYLIYCKRKGIQPIKDTEVKREKLCALLDKTFHQTKKETKNA